MDRPLFREVALATLIVALAAPSAGRACEKNSDCKPPTVCENRECVKQGGGGTTAGPAAKHHRKGHGKKPAAEPTPAPSTQ